VVFPFNKYNKSQTEKTIFNVSIFDRIDNWNVFLIKKLFVYNNYNLYSMPV